MRTDTNNSNSSMWITVAASERRSFAELQYHSLRAHLIPLLSFLIDLHITYIFGYIFHPAVITSHRDAIRTWVAECHTSTNIYYRLLRHDKPLIAFLSSQTALPVSYSCHPLIFYFGPRPLLYDITLHDCFHLIRIGAWSLLGLFYSFWLEKSQTALSSPS